MAGESGRGGSWWRGPIGRLTAPAVAALALVGGAAGAVSIAAPGLADAAPALAVVSSRPTLPSGARAIGALPGTTTIRGDVGLAPRDAAALGDYAEAVTTPGSPLYAKYLSRGQFAAAFGPAPSLVASVKRQLTDDHLSIAGTLDGGLLVSFSGSAAEVGSAFHTSFLRYRLPSGRTAFAETSPAELPASIASHVEAVLGLDNLTLPQPVGTPRGATGHAKAAAPPSSRLSTTTTGPDACTAANTAATEFGGLTDQQIASSYGVNGLYAHNDAGAGETIAVYEEEPFSMGDLATFDSCFFGSARAKSITSHVSIVRVDGGQQLGAGEGEAILDMEDVTALAPDASFQVYEAPDSLQGYVDNYAAYVQNDSAQFLTSSWGDCETYDETFVPGYLQISHVLFEQAAAQGQTVLNAIGDTGSDCMEEFGEQTPILSLTDTGDDPFVLGVGGTTITDATDPPSEQVWNDGADGGAGSGGISAVWGAPAWQLPFINSKVVAKAESVGDTDFCGLSACREAPDVSAQADEYTGAVTVYAGIFGGWSTIGGTSSSSPLWAAMLADIGSTPACRMPGHSLGFVVPKLYAVAGNGADYRASFNDITKGNNDSYGFSKGLYAAAPGYDMASGLGSPKVTGPGGTNGLAYYLCHGTGVTPTVTGVDSTSNPGTNEVATSDPGTATISGTAFESGSTPDVRGVTVGNLTARFSVTSATSLTVTLPSGAEEAGTGATSDGAGTQDITVTLDDGSTSAPSRASTVVYYSTSTHASGNPEVDGIEPPGTNIAGGQVFHVFGAGFGQAGGTASVTVGGAPATEVKVLNNDLISAVAPAEPTGSCLNRSADTGPGQSSFSTAVDTCQTQVQVTVAGHTSAEATIEPEYQGSVSNEGAPGTESYPAATELDYEPTPHIASIEVETGRASEAGDSEAVINGSGFGELGFEWWNVGPAQDAVSYQYSVMSITPTQLLVDLPGEEHTTGLLSEPVSVQSVGSPNAGSLTSKAPSNEVDVTYDPTPQLSAVDVLTPSGKLSRYAAGPTTGGTKIRLVGRGFENAMSEAAAGLAGISFIGDSPTVTFNLLTASSTVITFDTPGDNPSVDVVTYCNLSGCASSPRNGGFFTYYPLGNPRLSSSSPRSGNRGTLVTIHGANLGFVVAVYFGSVKDTKVFNPSTFLDSGDTSEVEAFAPSGTVGKKVDLRLVTVESETTGYGKTHVDPKVTFTFTKVKKKK